MIKIIDNVVFNLNNSIFEYQLSQKQHFQQIKDSKTKEKT